MRKKLFGGALALTLSLVTSSFLAAPSPAEAVAPPADPASWYQDAKLGIFSHYVPTLTRTPQGVVINDEEALAAAFDATQYAADVHSFGADYVVFTAWHRAMRPLYPSAAMEAIRPGNATTTEDVIQRLIDALEPYGIELMLYIHATDGHDFTAADQILTGWNDATNNYKVWNDFVNSVITEMGTRYGTGIDGYWVDVTTAPEFQSKIDRPRLRQSMLAGNPDRVLVGNLGFNYDRDVSSVMPALDFGSTELNVGGTVTDWAGALTLDRGHGVGSVMPLPRG